MEVVRDKDLERPVLRSVNQAVCGQFTELGQPFELSLPGNHPVAQELLDYLAIGAAFGAPSDGFDNRPNHGVIGVQVFYGAEIRQFHKIGSD